MVTSGTQNQQTRDEIGSEPSIHTIPKIKTENVLIPPLNIKTNQVTLGNAWIVGSSTNGLVGINTATQGGGQQVVGDDGRITTVDRVINTDNSYFEEFNTTTFEAAGTSTADWASPNIGRVNIGSAEAAESLDVYRDAGTLVSAIMVVSVGTSSVSNLTLQLSPDEGANYETVTNNNSSAFTNSGRALRFKIKSNSGTATVSRVQITYTTT